jgi:hypothetical protein
VNPAPELLTWVAGYPVMMTRNIFKIIRPLALASALLASAPFFVILDNTLYGKNMVVAITDQSTQTHSSNITVIFKS